jgi:hypothetical protein
MINCAAPRQVAQFAEKNPDVVFLQVNYETHKSMCYSLHVHVLPFFRFYRGAQGRVSSFSCTNATVTISSALSSHPQNQPLSSLCADASTYVCRDCTFIRSASSRTLSPSTALGGAASAPHGAWRSRSSWPWPQTRTCDSPTRKGRALSRSRSREPSPRRLPRQEEEEAPGSSLCLRPRRSSSPGDQMIRRCCHVVWKIDTRH